MARFRGRDSHSSGAPVARRLTQPTRTAGLETGLDRIAPARAAPIRFCSRWGLPCRRCCQLRGGLLPHPFTLTPGQIFRSGRGGLLSVALSLRSPSPGVTRHRVSLEPGLSSPAAFRRLRQRLSGRLAFADLRGFGSKVKQQAKSRTRFHRISAELQPSGSGIGNRTFGRLEERTEEQHLQNRNRPFEEILTM